MRRFFLYTTAALIVLFPMLSVHATNKVEDKANISTLANTDKFPVTVSPGGPGSLKNINWEDLRSEIVADVNWSSLDIIRSSTTSVFNIKNYGAVGDGTTDNTAAIQAAFEAAKVLGGTVFIPAGTFLTGDITIYKNVNISAVNREASIVKAKAGTTAVFNYSDTTTQDPNTNSTYMKGIIERVQIDCNSTGADGIRITRAPVGLIDGVGIYNCNNGIKQDGSWISSIQNSHIRFNVIGLNMTSVTLAPSGAVHDPNLIILDNTIFRENTSWGIKWEKGVMLVLDKCDIERNGTSGDGTTGGVDIEDANYNTSGGIGLIATSTWFESNWGRGDVYINTIATANTIAATFTNVFFYKPVPSGAKTNYIIDAPGANANIRMTNVTVFNGAAGGNIDFNVGGEFAQQRSFLDGSVNVGSGLKLGFLNTYNGNIGIGTTIPHFTGVDIGVAGAAQRGVFGAARGVMINTTSTTSFVTVNTTAPSASAGATIALGSFGGAISAADQRLGRIVAVGQTSAAAGGFSPMIEFFSAGAWTAATDYLSYIKFSTVPSGSTTPVERLRIYANGNVGIGTSSPGLLFTPSGGITSGGNVGISTVAPTTCGCAVFTNGLCTTIGTCT